MANKKQYDNKLKAKLALELLKGSKTVVELSAEYKVPQTNLYPLQFKSWDLEENAIYENYPSIGQPTGLHIH